MANLQLPPLSLYIHIPWCEKKCPYCDFNSHVTQIIPETDYINALLRDAESERQYVQGRKIHSIFIGGGTPSLFSAQSIAVLLEKLSQCFGFEDDIEITMEANPGSSEQKKFADLLNAGINRLSIGVQSFHDQQLRALGRVHCADEAKNAIKAAQQAGFQRINVDLMHGLPKQSIDAALQDLQTAIDFGVAHISWYQLTIEKNTAFFRDPPLLPIEDTLADIQDQGFELLSKAGFQQYEVSAFAKAGQAARHNLNYWHFGDYLAIGAGAHAKITLPEQQQIIRYHKTRVPKDYLARGNDFTSQTQVLTKDELVFEYLMNSLRLVDGTPSDEFTPRTGLTLEQLKQACQPLLERKLMTIDQRICTTELGFRYLNSALELLL
jgi:putative oxygen-independent coproporphyrinogen III oxidase